MASTLFLTAVVFFLFYYSFKIYYKLITGWCKSYVCLIGKTAIVTGANTGIGYYTALDLAKRGAKVILACRNTEKALEAQRKIIKASENKNVIVKELDLSSFQSTRSFAEDINKNEERLDLLIHNAGVSYIESTKTVDDIDIVMQTNYFSHFLLTHLLIGLLKKTASSRIVNVSSIAGRYGRLNLDKLTTIPKRQTWITKLIIYGNTKQSQILFTRELAKKLKRTGVTVYSVHPGCVKSDMFRSVKFPETVLWNPIVSWFFKSSEAGAQTTLHAALAKDIEHFSGEHFVDCERVPTYPAAANEEFAQKLWNKSEQIVKLRSDEVF